MSNADGSGANRKWRDEILWHVAQSQPVEGNSDTSLSGTMGWIRTLMRRG